MTERGAGIAAMVGACVIWGLSPIFYGALSHVPPLDILAHRTLWSLAFFAGLIALQGRAREVRAIAAPGVLWRLVLSGALISTNWFLFILATQIGRVTESSLGYYIFPLVAVLAGRLFFGERLSAAQWAAVALAGAAVALLAAGLGATPWLSLAIAVTFGGYGLVKRGVALGPVLSVALEVALLAPLAALWLMARGGAVDGATLALLALSGPITAVPLALFSFAARRVRLSTIGLVGYLNPSLQFACALIVFGEAVTLWHLIAFPAIWAALALYSADGLRRERASRRKAVASAASAARVM